jgi:asparagine synthase (glutamine-hydrolysing)
MCGICGILRNNGMGVEPERLIRMRDSLAHRGPDDAGALLAGSASTTLESRVEFTTLDDLKPAPGSLSAFDIGLAHRRLSIIDLSEAGHQPMANEDGTIWITYNGEVYNYRQIRSELIAAGHRFHSDTDTEVVVHAYEQWGDECLGRFNGMFAFAIYDAARRALFLARDRVGEKPLYYLLSDREFCFASELKAISLATQAPSAVDIESLNFYLALGYVPGDRCILKGVHKLPPAHAAVYDLATRRLSTWRYWDCPLPDEGAQSDTEEALLDELECLITDSVKLRLVADVPVGVFLSGGIDSSLITAIAARHSTRPIKTFTISFPDAARFDEAGYANRVAEYFGTEHHVLDAGRSVFDVMKELLPFIDEPLADSSLLPTYLVSKLTRQFVTVALGGDGGDELFGGYSHYRRAVRDGASLQWVPPRMLRWLGGVAGRLPAGVKGRNRLASLRHGCLEQTVWDNPYFDKYLRQKLFSDCTSSSFNGQLGAPEQWRRSLLAEGCGDIDRLTRLDLLSYLPDDILTKVDRAGMACSLEVRAPWLDHRIVEFAFRKVPADLKVRKGQTRILQKRLARRLLPRDLDLSRKHGFSVPMDDWLRTADGGAWARRILSSHVGLFNLGFIESLLRGQKRRSNGARLWSLGLLHQTGLA